MEKTISTRLNDEETLSLTLKNEHDDLYNIVALNNEEKEIASILFILKKRTCYMCRIEIFASDYAHKGVGTMLIKHMERVAAQKYCFTVDGRFYPFGDLGQYAANFYAKNGYKVYKDGYETYIRKSLDRNLLDEKTF